MRYVRFEQAAPELIFDPRVYFSPTPRVRSPFVIVTFLGAAFTVILHAFSVPSAVVDTLIRLAKENQLKVLLYLLRYPDKQLTVSQIASYLRIPEEQVEEALEWWSQVNILEEKYRFLLM